MYTARTLKESFQSSSEFFPVMLLTGARQVGKTTFLRHLSKEKRTYVTLDDPLNRQNAEEDPRGFLQTFAPPVLIDEIQYAPGLLPYIKMMVDENRQPGMFWLTGSQQFHMMKGVSESLAGRVGIVELMGLSNRELMGITSKPFLPETFTVPKKKHEVTLPAFYKKVWQGSYPQVALGDTTHQQSFYASYVQTYLERDVHALTQVGDLTRFLNFLRAAAARTGNLLNYSDLARDADVSVPTAKSWLSILLASGLIYLLPPYYRNITRRIVQAPKLYFLDTGLCAYLTAWTTPEVLNAGAMAGAFFESWCFSEIIKSYRHNGQQPPCYFYRDHNMKEVDLLIEQNGALYPVEFKKTASPKSDDAKNFNVLHQLKMPIGMGAVVCLYPQISTLSSACRIIPATML